MRGTGRLYNFAAGPATLPPEVLAKARESLGDWQGLGYSLLETPFSSDEFISLMETTRNQIKSALALPDDYLVLLLQGGASAQFSLVPLNLLPATATAGYVETGHWSTRAFEEGADTLGRAWWPAAAPASLTAFLPSTAGRCPTTCSTVI